jgi:hypothetical protein
MGANSFNFSLGKLDQGFGGEHRGPKTENAKRPDKRIKMAVIQYLSDKHLLQACFALRAGRCLKIYFENLI